MAEAEPVEHVVTATVRTTSHTTVQRALQFLVHDTDEIAGWESVTSARVELVTPAGAAVPASLADAAPTVRAARHTLYAENGYDEVTVWAHDPHSDRWWFVGTEGDADEVGWFLGEPGMPSRMVPLGAPGATAEPSHG